MKWAAVVWLLLVGLDVGTFVVATVMGLLAIRRARTRNRLGVAGFLTLYLEPDAFSGDGVRYRRWSIYATGLFLVIWLILWVTARLLLGPAR